MTRDGTEVMRGNTKSHSSELSSGWCVVGTGRYWRPQQPVLTGESSLEHADSIETESQVRPRLGVSSLFAIFSPSIMWRVTVTSLSRSSRLQRPQRSEHSVPQHVHIILRRLTSVPTWTCRGSIARCLPGHCEGRQGRVAPARPRLLAEGVHTDKLQAAGKLSAHLEVGIAEVLDHSGLLATDDHLISHFHIIIICIVFSFPSLQLK